MRLALVPSGPQLPGQQLPMLVGSWSHQKSSPLGALFGVLPVSVVLLPNLVRSGCGLNFGGTWPMWLPL